MIHEFYTVTATSLYHVKDKDEKNTNPYTVPHVIKLALKGDSKIGVGEKLSNGRMLAICKFLQLYEPEGGGGYAGSYERRIENVNKRYWGGHTSAIVALFKNEQEAKTCFESNDLKPCDPRWLEDTKSVIEAIDKNHPVFEVCNWPDLKLLP